MRGGGGAGGWGELVRGGGRRSTALSWVSLLVCGFWVASPWSRSDCHFLSKMQPSEDPAASWPTEALPERGPARGRVTGPVPSGKTSEPAILCQGPARPWLAGPGRGLRLPRWAPEPEPHFPVFLGKESSPSGKEKQPLGKSGLPPALSLRD